MYERRERRKTEADPPTYVAGREGGTDMVRMKC